MTPQSSVPFTPHRYRLRSSISQHELAFHEDLEIRSESDFVFGAVRVMEYIRARLGPTDIHTDSILLMLGKRSAQGSLFSPEQRLRHKIGEESFYAPLADHRHELFRDEDFAMLYI